MITEEIRKIAEDEHVPYWALPQLQKWRLSRQVIALKTFCQALRALSASVYLSLVRYTECQLMRQK